MKKIKILLIITVAIFYTGFLSAQVLSESAKRKVTVGVDIFTDIPLYTLDPLNMPADFSYRTINQGVNVFAMYNFQIGQSLSSFSVGLAIRNHNWYSRNSKVDDIKADTIKYVTIQESFKRTKINLTYLDLPVEFKYRTAGGFKFGIGLKVGYKIASKQRYVGDRDRVVVTDPKIKENVKDIKVLHTQDWVFGGTLRLGYKFISAFAYYQFNSAFEKGKGPQINPLSLGITITPF